MLSENSICRIIVLANHDTMIIGQMEENILKKERMKKKCSDSSCSCNSKFSTDYMHARSELITTDINVVHTHCTHYHLYQVFSKAKPSILNVQHTFIRLYIAYCIFIYLFIYMHSEIVPKRIGLVGWLIYIVHILPYKYI